MPHREQAADRIVHERRIAEIGIAVGERAPLGLDPVMDGLDRAVVPLRERMRLDDLRNLADRHRAGARRRIGQHRVAARDGLRPLRGVVGEIPHRGNPALRAACRHDRPGDGSAIERTAAFAGDQFQRPREHRPAARQRGDGDRRGAPIHGRSRNRGRGGDDCGVDSRQDSEHGRGAPCPMIVAPMHGVTPPQRQHYVQSCMPPVPAPAHSANYPPPGPGPGRRAAISTPRRAATGRLAYGSGRGIDRLRPCRMAQRFIV